MSLNESGLTHRKQLTRGITAAGAMLLVLNSVIGAGIFQLPAAVYPEAGIWSPWLFLVIGVLFITIVLTFAELASYFKDSGGPVLYTTTAFGPLMGFSTGWILFISRMTAFAANTTVMAIYLGDVVPWFADGIGRAVLIVAVCGSLAPASVKFPWAAAAKFWRAAISPVQLASRAVTMSKITVSAGPPILFIRCATEARLCAGPVTLTLCSRRSCGKGETYQLLRTLEHSLRRYPGATPEA